MHVLEAIKALSRVEGNMFNCQGVDKKAVQENIAIVMDFLEKEYMKETFNDKL